MVAEKAIQLAVDTMWTLWTKAYMSRNPQNPHGKKLGMVVSVYNLHFGEA